MYQVFKFGGASIENIDRIKKVGEILLTHSNEHLIIIFSAMGKVTNMLENLVESYVQKKNDVLEKFKLVKGFHENIINQLFDDPKYINDEINNLFVEIEWVLEVEPNQNSSYDYDQIVSVGELLSTTIMHKYLLNLGFDNSLYDARDLIRTDNSFRNAKIDWEMTENMVNKSLKHKHCITQGFIGCTSENFTTTLGREGSDFSASVLAYCLNISQVIIWKDVPALMNADPKYFKNTIEIEKISYDEVIELAYFGAKIIHPKTVQPLKKKNITLYIRSFLDIKSLGTLITKESQNNLDVPFYIVKENQILISICEKSLEFIVENHISKIFSLLALYSVEVNMMQNSAVSFSICVDFDKYKIPKLIKSLQKSFDVFYNKNLILYTIRHYNDNSTANLIHNKVVLLEQKTRNTLQIVVKDI